MRLYFFASFDWIDPMKLTSTIPLSKFWRVWINPNQPWPPTAFRQSLYVLGRLFLHQMQEVFPQKPTIAGSGCHSWSQSEWSEWVSHVSISQPNDASSVLINSNTILCIQKGMASHVWSINKGSKMQLCQASSLLWSPRKDSACSSTPLPARWGIRSHIRASNTGRSPSPSLLVLCRWCRTHGRALQALSTKGCNHLCSPAQNSPCGPAVLLQSQKSGT